MEFGAALTAAGPAPGNQLRKSSGEPLPGQLPMPLHSLDGHAQPVRDPLRRPPFEPGQVSDFGGPRRQVPRQPLPDRFDEFALREGLIGTAGGGRPPRPRHPPTARSASVHRGGWRWPRVCRLPRSTRRRVRGSLRAIAVPGADARSVGPHLRPGWDHRRGSVPRCAAPGVSAFGGPCLPRVASWCTPTIRHRIVQPGIDPPRVAWRAALTERKGVRSFSLLCSCRRPSDGPSPSIRVPPARRRGAPDPAHSRPASLQRRSGSRDTP